MPQFQAVIAPHTLSILPHPSNKEIIHSYKDLLEDYLQLADHIAKFKPDTIVIISPRGNCLLDGISINVPEKDKYIAKLGELEESDQTWEFDKANAHSITKRSREANLAIFEIPNDTLDYGTITPLRYLTSKLETKPELVYLTMGLIGAPKHYQLGKIIRKVYAETDKKVLFIASSALSHKLTKDSPGGYSRKAKGFENELRQDLRDQNYEAIQHFDVFLLDEVGELAIKPISTLLGFLSSQKLPLHEHTYCCPEGVGELLSSTFQLKTS